MRRRLATVCVMLLVGAAAALSPVRGFNVALAQENEPERKPQATPSAAGQPARVSRRKRIAVVDFEVPLELFQTHVKGRRGGGEVDIVQVRTAANRLSTIVSDMLISALVKTGNFEVIERTQLQRVLEEHQLSKEGLLDPTTAAKAGKILGVDLLLGGKLTEFGVKERNVGGLFIPVPFGGLGGVRKSTARAVGGRAGH
ncbi:MAG: CsgG/HfaB family protein [Abditibacteriales bacterium]|nr:CsgG/HfaB family protein [Abditibacteriales bacterium]MDW8364347.1 CsgG/HfaB family protein [Abditibacteriales bacterium]